MAEPEVETPDEDDDDEAIGGALARLDRDQDLLGRKNSKLRAKLIKDFEDIHKAFTDTVDRTDDQMDYWDCYDCVLNDHQFYNGQAQIYVPIVRDAINALTTRITNQLFPPGGHYVEGVSTDGTIPHAELAIVEHYIRELKLKTRIAKAMTRNGYVEGQYNLYVDWQEIKRQIVSRETHGVALGDDMENAEAPGDEIEDIKVEDIEEGGPGVKVLHDSDVMVLPSTVDSVEEALQVGGSVTIVRRWTKARLKKMIADGHILKREGEDLVDAMDQQSSGGGAGSVPQDAEKVLREHVGIKAKGGHVVVWETWKMLPLNEGGAYSEGGTQRLSRVFFSAVDANTQMPLGAKRNPNWNDRCPLLSVPVRKIAGVFKGESPVAAIASLQYEANDAANEGADAATYAAGPIVARDPEKSQANLIFNIGAVWDVSPADVKFMEFPDLTDRALKRIMYCATTIMQSMGVNPAMLPQQSGGPGKKRNQAEIAMELQVDLLTTAEESEVQAEGIWTPLVEWFVDLDHQYRDKAMTVRMYGEMGLAAEMESVDPLRNRTGVQFTWVGAEMARNNAAIMQQGTALLNVARGMRQDLKAEGLDLRIGPVLERAFSNVFGPKLARLTLLDQKSQLTIDPDLENELLGEGHDLQVHPLDQDVEHIQKHKEIGRQTMDPHGVIRVHIERHLMSMQIKAEAAMKQQMMQQQGAQGVPGGAGRGVAGSPRQGAQPAGPRLVQQPPGAQHADQMPRAGAVGMPRKT